VGGPRAPRKATPSTTDNTMFLPGHHHISCVGGGGTQVKMSK